jgi:arylsulfatase A
MARFPVGPVSELEKSWHFPHYSNHGMHSPGGAIRSGKYKLLEYFENGTVQLFDLEADIGEQHDLSEIEPTRTQELKGELQQWRTRVNAQTMKPNPDFDATLKAEDYYRCSANE